MPITVNLDLRITPAQRTAISNAMTTLETMCNSAKFQAAMNEWERMPDVTRQALLAKSPILARLLTLSAKLPRI
jgi:hypothetical protein